MGFGGWGLAFWSWSFGFRVLLGRGLGPLRFPRVAASDRSQNEISPHKVPGDQKGF